MEEGPLRVELGTRAYEVHIGPGVLNRAGSILRGVEHSSVLVVSATGVVERYGSRVSEAIRSAGLAAVAARIRSSERYKTLATVSRLYRAMLAAGLDRSSIVVAVGGGVLCDTVGFAAGTYMRGIGLVLAPTTLLAQVDAGIGGKTGVNLPEGKNLVGVFHQPRAVLVDTECLQSLPSRQYRSGLAELVKHGFIRDRRLVDEIQGDMDGVIRREGDVLARLVRRSLEIKAEVVARDEREAGPRALLNFGHTAGHAIETLGEYRQWLHGEAVAIGMVSACLVGEELGVTPSKVTSEVVRVLQRLGLPTRMPDTVDADAIIRIMRSDKKSRAGTLRFVLLRDIGEAEWGVPVEAAVVRRALMRQQALG